MMNLEPMASWKDDDGTTVVFAGDWSPEKSYAHNDVVAHRGFMWRPASDGTIDIEPALGHVWCQIRRQA